MLRSFRLLLAAGLLALTSVTSVTAGVSDAEISSQVKVSGVLVSTGGATALVNGRLVRAGERVGHFDIVAIESGLVHMRAAERAFSLQVGSSAVLESRYEHARADADVVTAHLPGQPAFEPEQPVIEPEMLGDVPASAYGPVAPGETLSEIAGILASEPEESAKLMASIYHHNPQAFGDSMHLLYAGTYLSLPEQADSIEPARFAAIDPVAAEPERFEDSAVEDSVVDDSAGMPATTAVAPGDTLSAIAANYVTDSITLNQAMLAIFEANRDSFGGNINVLYAFEILDLPDPTAWFAHTPQTAFAEVDRQASLWRSGSGTNST